MPTGFPSSASTGSRSRRFQGAGVGAAIDRAGENDSLRLRDDLDNPGAVIAVLRRRAAVREVEMEVRQIEELDVVPGVIRALEGGADRRVEAARRRDAAEDSGDSGHDSSLMRR
jgi:hypothetical protein